MTSQLTDIAALVMVIAVPLCGWLFSRVSKARQLETHDTIDQAVSKSKDAIFEHIDTRLESTDQRIADLAQSVQAIDAREDETRLELAHLKGRFDQQNKNNQGAV